MSPSFASLYSGCGGFDLGFIQAGYHCLGAFDIDPLAIKVHNSNLKSHACTCNLFTDSLRIDKFKGLDVLLSGSPCQGFSTVGKRNLDDPRNFLLVNGGRIAVAIRPKIFIAENVAGVIAGGHKKYWESLRETLRAADYHTADVLCDAHLMGVPQRRRRMMMIAWQGNSNISFTLPRINGGVVAKALHSINGAANHFPSALPANSHLKLIAKHIHQGQKLSNVRCGPLAVHTWQIPEVFGRTTALERKVLEGLVKLRRQNRVRSFGDADPVPAKAISTLIKQSATEVLESLIYKGYIRSTEGLYDLTHTFNGKYRRLALDSPSPTVDTRFGDPRYFLHPTRDRGLTVREAARIQGFPDNFIFDGPQRSQYRMVGNAVPPQMARLVAQFVRITILNKR